MSRLFTVCLVLGIAESAKANPLPASSGGQSEVSGQKLSNLSMLISEARNDASRIFSQNCQKIEPSDLCNARKEMARSSQNLPRYVFNRNRTLGEKFEDMYKVCAVFTNLLEQFSNDVQRQGASPDLLSNLTRLREVSLGSVKAMLMDLEPNMARVVSTSPQVDTSPDVTRRNLNNLLIVARLAAEMDNMWSAMAGNV